VRRTAAAGEERAVSDMQSKEPQYQESFDAFAVRGPVTLGPMLSDTWRSDPRRLAFVLARYKFVSKMLAGKASVLEIGSGDGFGMRLVLQVVGNAHGNDFDPAFVAYANKVACDEGLRVEFSVHDMTGGPPSGTFDAAYSLDVIEHIAPDLEERFVANIAAALTPAGVCIIGTPNVTSAPYASAASQKGHINLKSTESLRASLEKSFQHVFIFSMNDEVIHTGFAPMAHYLMALCVNPVAS
jgi:2-polyprenyl-3-methyl-5-hydroxy-6-metoxy-1,4-benzoquinol methylase